MAGRRIPVVLSIREKGEPGAGTKKRNPLGKNISQERLPTSQGSNRVYYEGKDEREEAVVCT